MCNIKIPVYCQLCSSVNAVYRKKRQIFRIIGQLVSCPLCLFVCIVQFGNKAVAQAACDVFQLLISHWEHLQRLEPTLPKKIIEVARTHTHTRTLESPLTIRGLWEHIVSKMRKSYMTYYSSICILSILGITSILHTQPWLSWWIGPCHLIIFLLVSTQHRSLWPQ